MINLNSSGKIEKVNVTLPPFIMITPAKNEEEFLPKVIKSVSRSSIKPALWIIVDDNSDDRTPEILQDATKKYSYIKILRINKGKKRNFYKYSYVCRIGFENAIKYSDEKDINWEFLVLLDADTIIERHYFESLILKMRRNPAIGIASGDVHILKNGKRHNIKVHGDYPSGTARIWKKKCFYQTDGYDLTIAPDSVSRIKAILKGWKTVRFPNIQALQLRETSSAEGFWKGYLIQGEASHHLGYPLLLVIARAMYCLIQPRFYLVIPYLIGYLESSIRKKPRIQDKEIIYYFKKRRLYELLSNWF